MGLSVDDILAISDVNTGFRTSRVTLCHASGTDCPTCGYSDLTRSSVRLDCPTCHGLGKTLTYTQQICLVRPNYKNLEWEQLDSGMVQIATVVMNVAKGDINAFKKARDTKESYLILDGYALKPIVWYPTLIGDEYMVTCQAINIEQWHRTR